MRFKLISKIPSRSRSVRFVHWIFKSADKEKKVPRFVGLLWEMLLQHSILQNGVVVFKLCSFQIFALAFVHDCAFYVVYFINMNIIIFGSRIFVVSTHINRQTILFHFFHLRYSLTNTVSWIWKTSSSASYPVQ